MKNIILFLSCIIFISCSSNHIYRMSSEIPDLAWNRSNILRFTPEIQDKVSKYNLTLMVRHTDAYIYTNLIITLKTIMPSGAFTLKDYNVQLRDEEKKFMGDGAGDIWDIDIPLEQNLSYDETGTFTMEVSQAMDCDPVQNLMEIGLIVEKAENK